jgi:hypothetical protein
MMNKDITMRNLFIFSLIVISSISFAQKGNPICDTTAYLDKMHEDKLLARIFVNPIISNNNQFFNYWTNGVVELSNGNKVKNELLRYNTFIDELLWLRKADYTTGIIYGSTVKSFVLYNDKNIPFATFKRIKLKNWYSLDSTYSYLQVLEEGKISLYVQRKVVKIGNIDKSTSELVPKDQYYLLKDGLYYAFVPSRMNLYRAMKEDADKMKSVVRSSHLRVRKEPQLIEAIKKYNVEFGEKK